jgi:hypothetical protein
MENLHDRYGCRNVHQFSDRSSAICRNVVDSLKCVGCFADELVDGDGLANWCEASSGSYG